MKRMIVRVISLEDCFGKSLTVLVTCLLSFTLCKIEHYIDSQVSFIRLPLYLLILFHSSNTEQESTLVMC